LNAVSANIHQSVRSPPHASPATPEGRLCNMRKHAGGVGHLHPRLTPLTAECHTKRNRV
jgi:hypothetical protein